MYVLNIWLYSVRRNRRKTMCCTPWIKQLLKNEAATLPQLSFEPWHDKTNKMSVRPAKSLISLGICPIWSVFAVRMKKAWVLSYLLSAQRRLWLDWADAQADLRLRWAHSHFVGFVMSGLIFTSEGAKSRAKCVFFFPSELQNNKTNKMTCVPSKNSDQPGHPPSLISLHFLCLHEETLGPWRPTDSALRAQRRLIRLDRCSGWSESSPSAHAILLALLCCGSFCIERISHLYKLGYPNNCCIANKWATTWQNKQNDWAPSEDSDQPGHPPSLISLRCALNG